MTYNEIMQKAGKRIHPKVYYYNDSNIKIEYEYDDIVLAKPFFNAKLLGTVMKGFSCTLKEELPDKPIYFSNTAKYNDSNATKTYGPYYIKSIEYNADSKEYVHELYDDFIGTMINYKPINITYPCTVLEFFKQLCVECGFTTNITSLPNGLKTMIKDIYDGIDFTYRDVFDDIGQATASLFKIHNNNVERCKFGTKNNIINDDILKNQNIQLGNHYGPINSIILKRSGDADGIYKRDETKTSWCELVIKDNQLMNNNDRSEYLPNLYNELNGIEFDLYDLELVGFGGFEPLEKVEIQTDNKIYNSFVFNNEMEFTQGFKEVIYNEQEENAASDYKVMSKTDKTIEQCWIICNKQTKQIEALINSQTQNETKMTNFQLSLDGITAQVENFNSQAETIAGINIKLNEIQSSIGSITDTTVTAKGTGTLTLENVLNSEILSLNIYPTSEDITYLYLTNDTLDPNAYLLSRDLVFTNEGRETRFTLPCDLLYLNNDCYDEFILNYETQEMYVIKRVGINANGEKYALVEAQTEYFIYQSLILQDGDYEIKMLSFPTAFINIRTLAKNLYTSQYATKVEMNSAINLSQESIISSVNQKLNLMNGDIEELTSKIEQTKNSITLDVNQKLAEVNANLELKIDEDTLISKINASADEINLKSNRFVLNSTYTSIAKDGEITCSKLNLLGGNIRILEANETGVEVYRTYNNIDYYTRQRAGGFSCFTNNILMARLHDGGSQHGGNLEIYDGNGSLTIGCSGRTGSITCVKLSQSSLESKKKNFERFTNALDIIDNIDLYKYNLKSEKDTDKKHIGFVIGKNFKYSKEITSQDNDGVDLYSMISLTLQALKELKNEVKKNEQTA